MVMELKFQMVLLMFFILAILGSGNDELPKVLVDSQSPIDDSAANSIEKELQNAKFLSRKLCKGAGFICYEPNNPEQFPAIIYNKGADSHDVQFPAIIYNTDASGNQFPAIIYGKKQIPFLVFNTGARNDVSNNAAQFPAIIYSKDSYGNQFPAIIYGKHVAGSSQFPAVVYAKGSSGIQFPAAWMKETSTNQFPAIVYSEDAYGKQFPAIIYGRDASGKQFPAIIYGRDASGTQFPAIIYSQEAQSPTIIYNNKNKESNTNQFPGIIYSRDASGNQFPAIIYNENAEAQFPAIIYGKDASGNQFPTVVYGKDAMKQLPAIVYGGNQFPAIIYGDTKDVQGTQQFPAIIYSKDESSNHGKDVQFPAGKNNQFPAIIYSSNHGKDESNNQFPAIIYSSNHGKDESNNQFPAIIYSKDEFSNHAKDAQFPAIIYGKDESSNQFPAIIYSKDASGNQFPAIIYGNQKQFPAIIYGKHVLGGRRALGGMSTPVTRYEKSLFMEPTALEVGKLLTVPPFDQKFPTTKFLHPLLESAFKKMNVDKLLSMLQITKALPLAATIKEGDFACAQKALPRETRGCHATVESMVNFVKTVLSPQVESCKASSNSDCSIKHLDVTLPNESPFRSSFVDAKVVKKEVMANKREVVVCHPVLFAYSVYMCHAIPNNAAFQMTLQPSDGGEKLVVPAVCHFDTSMFNPGFISFKVLENKPGDPVCHWVATNSVIWYV